MQTMQQERARYALEQVETLKKNGIGQKEFKSYAASFPAMIRMNGLGQAAAFYRSKGAEDNAKGIAYLALYDLLCGWLAKEGQPYAGCDLLQGITANDMRAYRLAQAEAMLVLDWVKKFAKAYMEEEQQ
ncbi:MAG: type III-B CRISPR module-associated protein Cmr5 [Sulfuricellaceae bacterium]